MEGSGILNLLTNVPPSIFNKVVQLASTAQFFTDQVQIEVLFGENVNNVREGVDNLGGTFEDLGYGFGIITLPVDKLKDISTIQGIQYLEIPKLVFTSSIDSLRASCVPEVWAVSNLTGRGVLIGFIDTGLQYTNNAFRNQDGTTRIEFLYDQVSGGQYYSKEQINQALQSNNPLSVVNFTDSTGHGTSVVGIACAGGNIDRNNYGAAYESSIAMVKITGAEGINFSLSSQVMRALRVLTQRARELSIPLVVNLSWSTNDGAHNGSSILEQYISTINNEERVTMVIAAGNEGDTAHHVGGDLQPEQDIPFSVSRGEPGLVLQLYAPVLSELSFEITNPLGKKSGRVTLTEGYNQVALDRDYILNYNTGPKPFNIEGEIIISIVSAGEQDITPGQWSIKLINESTEAGRFDMWMSVSTNLKPNTRFLNPDIYNTLGIPATVQNVISVGSYNFQTLSISPFSGRGIFGRGFIKPEVTAPGENITTTLSSGGFGEKSGTSMAAPQVSGICALFKQWGIVQGNDPFLYGDRLKYYIVKGAVRRSGIEEYPNPTWGYGRVCARNIQNLLRSLAPTVSRQQSTSPQTQTAQNPPQGQSQAPSAGQTPQPAIPLQQPATPVQPSSQAQGQGATQQPSTTPQTPTIPQGPATQAPAQSTGQASTAIQSQIPAQSPTAPQPAAQAQLPAAQPSTTQVAEQQQEQAKANFLSPNYFNFIVQYSGDIVNDVAATGLGTAFIVNDRLAIISVQAGKRQELLQRVPSIVFLDPSRYYILNQVSPLDTANIIQLQNNPFVNLTGRGVLIGLIDTGIDYTNQEFIFENNTTRVERLWDQTIQTGQPPQGYIYGTEYTADDINRALSLSQQGGDPYSIVPSRDENGHGTHMAGIMGARGATPGVVGAAPDARFVVVKLRPANLGFAAEIGIDVTQIPVYKDPDMLLALKYIYETARQIGSPISILIPLSTNFGPHDGSLILERYIDNIVDFPGVSVTIPVGNEGLSDTHTEGVIGGQGETQDIELQIGEGDNDMIFEIWFQKPDRVSIGMTSPSGEVIQRLPIRTGIPQEATLVYEKTTVSVLYEAPDPSTGDEHISVTLTNVVPGNWKFTLYGELILNGRYNAWLPSRQLLKGNTRFLSPSQNITLTPPSTAAGAISVGYYNQNNNTIEVQSGRGFTRSGAIKPDLAAGGVNATTTAVGGGTTTVTGSSVAGAVTAGAVALMLQWAIVDNKDVSFNNQIIKGYLIAGADRKSGEVYPNRQWGYGTLNLTGVFDTIRNGSRSITSTMQDIILYDLKETTEEKEYNLEGLYVRIPGNFLF